MNSLISVTLFLLTSLSCLGAEGTIPKFFLSGGYYYNRVNPSPLNKAIDDTNSAATAAGAKGFGLSKINSLWGPGFTGGYQISDDFSIGASYSYYSTKISSSGDIGGTSFSADIETGVGTVSIRPQYYFFRQEAWALSLIPSIGYSTYTYEGHANGGGSSTGITSDNSRISFKGSLGAEYTITPYIGIGAEAGYAYAKSDTLKITGKSGSSTSVVGENQKFSGQDASLNLSGFLAGLNLIVRFPVSSNQEKPAVNNSAAPPAQIAPQEQPKPTEGIKEKLIRLENMKKEGIITEEEYQRKRKEMLERL